MNFMLKRFFYTTKQLDVNGTQSVGVDWKAREKNLPKNAADLNEKRKK